jgi:hypothetical protein
MNMLNLKSSFSTYNKIELVDEENGEAPPPIGGTAKYVGMQASLARYIIVLVCGILIGLAISIQRDVVMVRRKVTPIPQKIFDAQQPVKFVPDERYIGGSTEVHQNWRKLVAGRLRTCDL